MNFFSREVKFSPYQDSILDKFSTINNQAPSSKHQFESHVFDSKELKIEGKI